MVGTAGRAWTSYENREYGYGIAYPGDWTGKVNQTICDKTLCVQSVELTKEGRMVGDRIETASIVPLMVLVPTSRYRVVFLSAPTVPAGRAQKSPLRYRPVSRPVVAAARLTVLTLGTVTFVAVAWRVLIALPTPYRVVDQKLGAFMGVISALGIALGGYQSVREQRTRLFASTSPASRSDALASVRDSG